MRICLTLIGTLGLSVVLCGCSNAPGKAAANDTPVVPNEVSDFNTLYADNCSGCHGPDGKGGAAISLADPVYLAIADDTIVRRAVTNGIPGTSMAAFAQSAGGMLTAKQVDAIVGGIRERWSKPGILTGTEPPPYAAPTPGDSARGPQVYATYCSSCHGADGRGTQKASSIVDGSFLALLTDQELRTIVIAGRPELGAPDWRGDVPGKPMSAQDISDVVAWLASQRAQFPGQPYPNTAKSEGLR